MPIGKDSIKTRVAKVAPVEEETAEELPVEEEIAEDLLHYPEDIISDEGSADEILENGFKQLAADKEQFLYEKKMFETMKKVNQY